MSRSASQRAKLQAMGLRVWQPAAALPLTPNDTHAVPASMHLAAQAPAVVLPEPARPFEGAQATGATMQSDPPAAGVSELSLLGWQDLQLRVSGCRACTLCEGRHNTVFGVGHRQAHWMIVGEAPGEQEDLKGEPFVGPAGQLLDRMLFALGLTRGPESPQRQVFITNTLKCRPPRNRNPTAEELALCLPFLQRQVALVQPKVIVAMGRFAIEALTGSTEAVGKLRGRVHLWQGIPVVPTYHPAYLLRSPGEKAKSWLDLSLAAEVVRQRSV